MGTRCPWVWVQVCSGTFHSTPLPSTASLVPPPGQHSWKVQRQLRSGEIFFSAAGIGISLEGSHPESRGSSILGSEGVARPQGLRVVPLLCGRGLGSCETHEVPLPIPVSLLGLLLATQRSPGLQHSSSPGLLSPASVLLSAQPCAGCCGPALTAHWVTWTAGATFPWAVGDLGWQCIPKDLPGLCSGSGPGCTSGTSLGCSGEPSKFEC